MQPCPNCGAFVLVDMDGSATIAQTDAPIGESVHEQVLSMPSQDHPSGVPEADDAFIPAFQNENQTDEPGPSGDVLGLSKYASSEVSQAKDGVLLFRLFISGIDTKELRESIREALEDSRFAWDPAGLLASIDRGRLTIDSLSPVKATILVNRIKPLPVKIRWEQYAITRSNGT
jgi:hypothetical protein